MSMRRPPLLALTLPLSLGTLFYAVDARGLATASSYVASTLKAALGMISPVRDVEQFDLGLKNGSILRPEWRTVAWTPPTDGNGQPRAHPYRWFVQTYNGGLIAWKFAVSGNASSSMIISLPRHGATLILPANSAEVAKSFDLAAGDVTVSLFARLLL